MWKLKFIDHDDIELLSINCQDVAFLPRAGEIVYLPSGIDYAVVQVYYEFDTNTIVEVVTHGEV